jgi:regulator of sirC expression with transglutaminase-like and TPR domain
MHVTGRAIFALGLAVLAVQAARAAPDRADAVRAVLAEPEDRIDFAYAKLTLDKLVEPGVDVTIGRKRLDGMAAFALQLAGPHPSEFAKLNAVRRYIYESGPWNGYRPFGYDLDDPLGQKPSHRLLMNYLVTGRGNCVSMPALFLILASKLGLDVTLSIAPQHELVKFIGGDGRVHDIETTSGAFTASDAWYRHKLAISDAAVSNGVYLKALTRRETLAVLAEPVLEDAMAKKRYDEAAAIADLLLAAYPAFANALVLKGGAYEGLVREKFRKRYRRAADIPQPLRPQYIALQHRADAAFDAAEALGVFGAPVAAVHQR